LPDFIEASILANARRVGEPFATSVALRSLFDRALSWWVLYLGAGLLILRWAARLFWREAAPADRRSGPVEIVLLIWLAGDLAGICAAKTFYPHYFLQALPVLCIVTTVGLARLFRSSGQPAGGARMLILLSFIMISPLSGVATVMEDTLMPAV